MKTSTNSPASTRRCWRSILIDGGWFWWTDAEKPENTAALWRLMYDYFVHQRKLNNLIWVYSAAVKPSGKDKDGPRWLFCIPWTAKAEPHPPEWMKKTYNHELVITRDQLPKLNVAREGR